MAQNKINKKNVNIRLNVTTIEKLQNITNTLNISTSSIIELILYPIDENNINISTIRNNNVNNTQQINLKADIKPKSKRKPVEVAITPEEIKERRKKALIKSMRENHIYQKYGEKNINVDELDESYFSDMSPIRDEDF